jgi:predicted metallo-beta-lactamase superfamily hydrolase
MEHHALRDAQWRIKAEPIYLAAEKAGHRVVTAAEFAGEENLFLESKRKQLYEKFPPSKEFQQWTCESEAKISHVKPPT